MTTLNPEAVMVSLLQDLDKLQQAGTSSVSACQESARICAKALHILNSHATAHIFLHPDAEIYFFKYIKPTVEGRLLYYLDLIDVHSLIPRSSEDGGKAFWRYHIDRIQTLIRHRRKLFLYFRSGAKYFDHLYFVRPTEIPVTGRGSARQLSFAGTETLKSYAFAELTAAELLLDYFQHQLQQPDLSPALSFTWTGSQAALTELVYALNEMAVLDGNRHEITRVKNFFERIFNISLGNIYKTYEHNRLRKKGRTPFLDNAKMALERRYDYDDEHAL